MTEILITSSVLILAVAVLRAVFKSRISARLQYAVWLLVALRLLIPVQFGSSDLSVTQLKTEKLDTAITQTAREPVAGPSYEEVYDRVSREYASQGQDISAPAVQQQIQIQTTNEIQAPTLGEIATAVWLVGIAVMALWFLFVNLRLRRKLRKDTSSVEAPDCPVPVMICPELSSPCLSGILRPTVYLTPACVENPQRLKHILAHELTHLRHGDLFWSIIRSVCLCVYWFDPLVWAAAVLSKRDCELACDEGALAVLGEDQRLAYGTTLLDTVARTPSIHHLAETATSMNETKKQLTERVRFIVKKPKFYLTVTVCLILALCVAVGCTFTGSPDPTAETTAIDWTLYGTLITADGEILETIEFTLTGTVEDYPDDADQTDVLSLDVNFPDSFRYTYDSFEFGDPNIGEYLDVPYYVSSGLAYDRSANAYTASGYALSMEKEYIVMYWQDADSFLIASRDPKTEPGAIMDHFREFLDLYAETPPETTDSLVNTWSMQAALVNNKGEVLETMELSAEVMVWDQNGREYYSLNFSYPEDIYNSVSGVMPYPDDENAYTCCYGIGTEKGLEGKSAALFYVGFDLAYEAFIVDFDDGQDVYLIAYRSADADLSTLWTHFQDFIAMVQPTTEPTEVEDPVINWAIPDYPTMSYDEYFSQTRYYYYVYSGAEDWKKLYYWGGWKNGTDRCEVWHSDGKIFAGSSIAGKYVQVGDTVYEDIDVVGCDEQWIYAIENHTELFRIDYYGENRQTLYVDESQRVATWDTFSVHPRDGCVLFFTAGYGDGYGIYRLYLPDMTLDLLYTTETRPFLYAPYSNFEITWSENADGTNGIFEIDYYYNCLSGELLERPVYGDRSWGNTTWAWWAETEGSPTEPPTEPTEPLSLEEQFQNLLSYDGDYWLWRTLGCTFEDPQDISLKYLFYNGLRHDERESRDDYSDSEVAFLRDYAKNSFWQDEESWVNALKIPAPYLADVLEEYLGLSPDQVTIPEDWAYFEETDAYYSIRSDAYGVSGHTVTEVTVLEDGTVQVCWTVGLLKNTLTGEFMENPQMVLTLRQKEDGSYQALSNQPKGGDAYIAPQ